MERSRAELAAISEQITRESPADVTPHTAGVIAIREALTGDFRSTFSAAPGRRGDHEVIGCANITNPLLVRYAARRFELAATALRWARGAPRFCATVDG